MGISIDLWKVIVIIAMCASAFVAFKIMKLEREQIKKYGWRHNYKTTIFTVLYIGVYAVMILWILFTI